MSTVYKIEIELTSHWVNYPPEEIKEMLDELFENNSYDNDNPNNEIDVEIKVERKK